MLLRREWFEENGCAWRSALEKRWDWLKSLLWTDDLCSRRVLLLLLGLVSLMGMPYAVLMPVIADKILGGGSSTLGFLMGASGIGALSCDPEPV